MNDSNRRNFRLKFEVHANPDFAIRMLVVSVCDFVILKVKPWCLYSSTNSSNTVNVRFYVLKKDFQISH